MDPDYVHPSLVVPGFENIPDRVMFFMQVGRTEEAADLAEWWLGNAGWNNYTHAVVQAMQRNVYEDPDPYISARQNYENEFHELDRERVMLLNAIYRGYAQQAPLEDFAAMLRAGRYGEQLATWRRLNETQGTWETRNWRHVHTLRDATQREDQVATNFPSIGVDENAPPGPFAAPAPVVRNSQFIMLNGEGEGTARRMREL